jgi:hypothetical protein
MSDATFQVNADDGSLYLVEEERLEGAYRLRSYATLNHPMFPSLDQKGKRLPLCVLPIWEH